MGDQHFLNIEQIIPTKDVEDFMIGIADKSLDEVEGATEEKNRHRVRREFWTEIIRAISGKTGLFQNISPSSQGWIINQSISRFTSCGVFEGWLLVEGTDFLGVVL